MSEAAPDAAFQADLDLDPDLFDGDGPSKGLRETTLLSIDERLAGRPKLCSDCGLWDGAFNPLMAKSCVFVRDLFEQPLIPSGTAAGASTLAGAGDRRMVLAASASPTSRKARSSGA